MVGVQPCEIVGRLGGGAGGGEDGLLVDLEDFQPVVDVGGMVGARFQRDPEIGAKEGRAQLGHEFFDRIGFIAEAFAECTVAAFGAAGPVCQFMEQG